MVNPKLMFWNKLKSKMLTKVGEFGQKSVVMNIFFVYFPEPLKPSTSSSSLCRACSYYNIGQNATSSGLSASRSSLLCCTFYILFT